MVILIFNLKTIKTIFIFKNEHKFQNKNEKIKNNCKYIKELL